MKIKELFTDESKWTQGSYAKDINKKSTLFNDKRAVCWCLWGAIYVCYPTIGDGVNIMSKVEEKLHQITKCNELSIAQWNDDPNRTFEEVKGLVDELDI